MSHLLRLGLVVLFLLLPPGAFLLGGWSGNIATRFDISDPPDTLANAIDERLDPYILRVIQPDKYLMRHLTGAEGSNSSVFVSFYSGYGTTGAHDPAVCYPSQGWELSQVGFREVPLPNDESLTASFFRATNGRDESLVLYWFQPAGRWSQGHPEEMFFRVFDAVSGRKRYAFVRLSTPLAMLAGSGSESAQELLLELAGDLAPWVRRVVDGELTGSPSDPRPGRSLTFRRF